MSTTVCALHHSLKGFSGQLCTIYTYEIKLYTIIYRSLARILVCAVLKAVGFSSRLDLRHCCNDHSC